MKLYKARIYQDVLFVSDETHENDNLLDDAIEAGKNEIEVGLGPSVEHIIPITHRNQIPESWLGCLVWGTDTEITAEDAVEQTSKGL